MEIEGRLNCIGIIAYHRSLQVQKIVQMNRISCSNEKGTKNSLFILTFHLF